MGFIVVFSCLSVSCDFCFLFCRLITVNYFVFRCLRWFGVCFFVVPPLAEAFFAPFFVRAKREGLFKFV